MCDDIDDLVTLFLLSVWQMTPTSSQLLSERVRAKSVANPTSRSPVTNYLSAMEGSFCCVVDIVRFLFSYIVVVVVLPKIVCFTNTN